MSVSIGSHYAKCGRNFWRRIENGEVKFRIKENGKYLNSKFIIEHGDVAQEEIQLETGMTRITRYGEYIKRVAKNGVVIETIQLRKGSNCAKIPKGIFRVSKCKLGTFDGTMTQKCSGGSMRREEFVYKNKKKAYSVYSGQTKGDVLYPNGKVWMQYEGKPSFGWKDTIFQGGKGDTPTFEVFDISSNSWNSVLFRIFNGDFKLVVYDVAGQIKFQGQRVSNQNTGKWISEYKPFYFLNGVECPVKLFEAKPEEMNSAEIMAIKNIQLRTALAMKKGYENILRDLNGTLVDTDGDYALYQLPIVNPEERGDKVVKLLKVKCPSTGAYYTLRVHPDCSKVEQARQWTFGAELVQGSEAVEEALELIKET